MNSASGGHTFRKEQFLRELPAIIFIGAVFIASVVVIIHPIPKKFAPFFLLMFVSGRMLLFGLWLWWTMERYWRTHEQIHHP